MYAEAQRRISWLGFMSKRDLWKETRILGIFRDLSSRRIWVRAENGMN
jgi:hypothetical protein